MNADEYEDEYATIKGIEKSKQTKLLFIDFC